MRLKQVKYAAALSVLLLSSIISAFPATRAFAVNPNLMQNPSAEVQNNDGTVANWTPNSWGTSATTLAATNDAHTGTKALTVTTTSRSSGDAKWIPDASPISAGQQYDYSDYYKASVATELDAAYTDASGAVSYYYLSGVAASTTWTQTSVALTAPANTVSVAILHILTSPGTLTTDDFSLTAAQATPPPSNGNLIADPSMETANGQKPAGWQTGTWGTNDASFSYNQTGHTGNRSVSVKISNYTSGDAKWYATPVSVTAGSNYTYSDSYTATIASRVVAAYATANGTYSYVEPPQAPAASSWATYTTSLTIPANITSVTIYHLIDTVGSLSLDDVALEAGSNSTPPPVVDPLAINNPSVETSGNGTTPDGWSASSWGTNDASFSYVNDGHTGNKSVKTTITSYTSGDAKWYFTPVTGIQPGKSYNFSAWLKSNTQAHMVVAFTLQDGSTRYANLANPQGVTATSWQHYSGSFQAPANASAVTVYALLSSAGWLESDDYSLSPYVPAGFSEGLVSLTFDDGWQSTYKNGLPLLKKYGLISTQYIISGYVGANQYMTAAQIKAFQAQGSEIGSHTITHPDLTTLTPSQLTQELQQSQISLRNQFGNSVATDFASPYGAYNDNVITNIKKYYRSHRSTDTGFNSKDNFNIYNIEVQNVDADTPNSQIEAWVNQAKAQHTWLVLVYHQVENTLAPADIYAVKTSNLNTQLNYIKSTGITVKTISGALDEVTPQL